MAEARPSSLISHLRARGFNVASNPAVSEHDGYLTLKLPLPSTLVRAAKARAKHLLLELNRSMWPATPATLATVVLAVTWGTVQASSDSWLRSGWLANLLWRVDEVLNPARNRLPIKLRVAYLAVLASGLGMFCISLTQRVLLRALLSWKGWAYSTRTHGFVPWHVTLWGQAVRSLAGGPTLGLYAYQAALPSQPVPSLSQTVSKAVASLAPMLSARQLAELDALAAEFLAHEGPRLQRYLMLKYLTSRNYVTDLWERYVYLMGRGPLIINSNYFVMDALKTKPTADPVFRAANLIFRMLEFEDMIFDESLPPSRLRETVPLDMRQYAKMFGTTRIPGVDVDKLQTFRSDWIVVTRRSKLFKLVTRHVSSGKRLSHAELAHQLRVIAEEATFERGGGEAPDLMALTALPRAQWARIRQEEFEVGANAEALDTVDRASFLVHLHDQPSDASPAHGSKRQLRQARALFHGDGASLWFDKSLQLVVFEDGHAGLNAEHSWADAPMVSHMFEHVLLSELHDVQQGVDASSLAGEALRGDPLPIPTKIEFVVPEHVHREAAKAKRATKELIADLDMAMLEFGEFGDARIKDKNLSPDAFVQLSLQLAYFRKQAKFDLVYESCTARLFRDGRTETIRALTSESVAFCRAMQDREQPAAAGQPQRDVRDLLRQANDAHAAQSRSALIGHGIDRHLFAMYVVAKGSGTSSAFLDYLQAVPWRLSTSQQPQRQTALREGLPKDVVKNFYSSGGGFAPADDEGYGVCYTFGGPDRIFFHVASKNRSKPVVDAAEFVEYLHRALADVMAVAG